MAAEKSAEVQKKPSEADSKLQYLEILLSTVETRDAIDKAVLGTAQVKEDGKPITISRVLPRLPELEEKERKNDDAVLSLPAGGGTGSITVNAKRVRAQQEKYHIAHLDLTQGIIWDGVISTVHNDLLKHYTAYAHTLPTGMNARGNEYIREEFYAELATHLKEVNDGLVRRVGDRNIFSLTELSIGTAFRDAIRAEMERYKTMVDGTVTAVRPRIIKIMLVGEPGCGKEEFLSAVGSIGIAAATNSVAEHKKVSTTSIATLLPADSPMRAASPGGPDVIAGNLVVNMGSEFRVKVVTVDREKIKLQIWDTAGQEQFGAINTAFYCRTHAVFVFYSIQNKASFEAVDRWVKHLDDYASHVQIGFVGMDYGLPNRVVSEAEGRSLAQKHNAPSFECSAADNLSIEEALEALARAAIRKIKLQPPKPKPPKPESSSRCSIM